MNEDIKKAIGLFRHQVISPVLMEIDRGQRSYFQKIAQQEFTIPGIGKKIIKPETMRGWLKKYRLHGFTGLVPKERNDLRKTRCISPELQKQILDFRKILSEFSVSKFYRTCKKENMLGKPPLSQQTIRRFLENNKVGTSSAPQARKRYEMDRFGELWVGDFMHGPVLQEPKNKKAILLAFIDDHSRMIVGYRWSFEETTLPVEHVLKEALLRYGKSDKIYVDNGSSFSSDYLRLVCAECGIALIHSKPYDSPSRGKIERFWRTVRMDFLSEFKGQSLNELNDAFDIWLRDSYHNKLHNGIDCKPIDRYELSLSQYPREKVNEEKLEELFLAKATRKVNLDSTISFKKLIYEVPAGYIRKKIEIRYQQDRPQELYLYKGKDRVCPLKVVDTRANGKMYKPRKRTTVLSYQDDK